MKIKNKLIPTLTTICAVSCVCPLVTLSSCGNKEQVNGNLMEEYTPTIKQRTRANSCFDTPELALNTYLQAVKDSPEIFEQDLLYTLSRGLPQYTSYISEYCEIKEQNYGIKISNILVTNTDTAKTISFDITFDVLFDFTGTKYEEMVWYDLFAYRWDTQTVAHVIFDFDTSKFDEKNIKGQRSKMTTYAGATQFGISELNSSIQLKSEKGSYVDLDGIEHKIDNNDGEATASHFIMPCESYWSEQKDEYNKIVSEINNTLISHPAIKVFTKILEYYMFNNGHSYPLVPNSFDFGSYYMGNSTLNKLYETQTVTDASATLCGFNFCLDLINNYQNLLKEGSGLDVESKTLTLPKQQDKLLINIGANAFDGSQTTYTNVGIPYEIKNLVIPSNYLSIGKNAFACNNGLESIKFGHTSGGYPDLMPDSFYKLLKVTKLDFSEFKTDELATFTTAASMKNIHLGNSIPSNYKEGQIVVPAGTLDDQTAKGKWIAFINNIGLNVWEEGVQVAGWELVEPQA